MLSTPVAPDFVDLGDGGSWAPEALFAVLGDPEVLVAACPAAGDDAPIAFELEVAEATAPETSLAQGVAEAAARSDFPPECLVGSWRVPVGVLADGGEYVFRGRSVGEGSQVSGWTDWSSFTVALTPTPPGLVAPEAGEAVPTSRPAFEVAVAEPRARDLSGIFRVVYAGTEFTAAEGVSSTSDDTGHLVWELPTDLRIGNYEWQALLTDGVTQSEWSEPVPFRVSLAPPNAPNVYSAALVRGGATFVWSPLYTAPEDPILGYTITADPGGRTVTVAGDQTTGTIDQLPAGQYSVSISGWNLRGSSPATTRTTTVMPASPAAPENAMVTLDGTAATLTWQAPADHGDAPVDLFRVSSPGWAEPLPAVETTDLSVTLTDLQYATWYTVYVQAHNAHGWSAPAVISFAPFTVPGAPTEVQTRLGDGYLDLTWQAPPSDGGSAVTGYVVVASPGGARVATDGATSVRFPDLENDTPYTFTVAAVNDAGAGPESTPTEPRAPTSETTDTDADGLPDILEERTGANPLLGDSDFDGLGDADEFSLLSGFTSPVSPDSDGDGIGDAESDSDGDGITNAAEIQAGLKPADPDTDGDTLQDGEEVAAGTDPLAIDTDSDGLADDQEYLLGLDPLAQDTDGDGTPDASSPADLVIDGDGASVAVAGTAADVSQVVLDTSEVLVVEGAVTGVATVGTRTVAPVETPTVASFFTAESGDSAMAHVAVTPLEWLPQPTSLVFTIPAWQALTGTEYGAFEWDPETTVWRPSGASVTVSADTDTITVHSPELGVSYTVVDLEEWRAQARECDLADDDAARLSIEVVLDDTSSVRGLDPTGERFAALSSVLSTLEPGDDATLRTFGVLVTNFGYGESYDAVHGNGPEVQGLGSSVDMVREQVALLAEEPGETEWVDHDTEIPDFAEAALGGPSWLAGQPHSNPFVGEEFESIPQWCRADVVVLVTDGQLVPPATAPLGQPTAFRERTSPAVYVLDVGPGGEEADWLRQVAEQTGGAYTHVPTATTVPTWNRDLGLEDIDPAEYLQDPDGDGVPTWVEVQGIRASAATRVGTSVGRHVFYSDPMDPDTDDDGIADGDELGVPLTATVVGGWGSEWPITTYWMLSDPARGDSDHDGLLDTEEVDLGLNALNADVDSDGLPDGGEAEWGTNPFKPDHDMDGFTDGFEAAHVDEGYDPVQRNETEDPWAFFADFATGFFCGDVEYCRRASIAWLLGNISSGIAVFGDVRDFIWSVREGAAVNATMIAVGFIPGVGDVAGAGAKITRMLPDLTGPAADAGRMLLRQTTEASEFIRHMRDLHPDLVLALERAGTSTESMARLLTRNKPEHLKALLDSARVWPTSAYTHGTPTFMPDGEDGERFMRNFLGLDPSGHESGMFLEEVRPDYCRGCRYPDGVERLPTGDVALHESKVGSVNGGFANTQIDKD